MILVFTIITVEMVVCLLFMDVIYFVELYTVVDIVLVHKGFANGLILSPGALGLVLP